MTLKVFKKRIKAKQTLFTILISSFLILSIFQTQSTAGSSVSHPQAILSISGTLGDNGWYTSDVEASLYVIGGDDSDLIIAEYTLYNRGWMAFEEPFTIFQEGQTTVYYRIRNEDTDFVGETKFSMIDIDKTPPTGLVTIDGGNSEAYSTNVTLTFSIVDEPSGPTTNPPSGYIWGVPSGPSDIRFSNNGHLWSPWTPIVDLKSWVLDSSSGTKTVYAQARDNAGLISEPFSDTINLVTAMDTMAPVTKIVVNGKQTPEGIYTSPVAVTLSCVDDLSGVSFTEYSFDNNTWTKYHNPLPIQNEGSHVIYYRSCDAAGNIEPAASQTIQIAYSEAQEPLSPLTIFAVVFSITIGIIAGSFIVKHKTKNYKLNPKPNKTTT